MLADTAAAVTSGMSAIWSQGIGLFGAQTLHPEDFSADGDDREIDPALGAWGLQEYELDPFLDVSAVIAFWTDRSFADR